jgi:small-conductance mechanosensitive channel
MGEPYDTISAYVVIFGGLALGALIVAAIVGLVVGSVIGNIVAGRVCSD